MEWSQGRYESIGEQLLPAAAVVIERPAPAERERVVDLGRGTGNGALLAAGAEGFRITSRYAVAELRRR